MYLTTGVGFVALESADEIVAQPKNSLAHAALSGGSCAAADVATAGVRFSGRLSG